MIDACPQYERHPDGVLNGGDLSDCAAGSLTHHHERLYAVELPISWSGSIRDVYISDVVANLAEGDDAGRLFAFPSWPYATLLRTYL